MRTPTPELPERVVRVRLARPIMALLRATVRFLLIEGAMRASKTWGCLIKVRRTLDEYPGISCLMARWKEDDLDNKLVPDYRKVCDLLGLPYGQWNAKESCYDFPCKACGLVHDPDKPPTDHTPQSSRLYAIHLKSSEKASVHSKPRGFTVAGVYISQLEEVPHDVAREWMLRLSQPGFPHQFLADANPVHEGHWMATEWPTDNSAPDHLLLTASIWDNAHNLDASTIEAAEAMYPVGHPMRPAKLEGKRGANTEGDPVYGDYFRPSAHIYPGLEPWPHAPILVSWDFGSKHPAVSFSQVLPWGAFWSLGAVMGDNVMLEWFAPRLLLIAAEWFPGLPLLHCGDPAGAHRNSQGVTLNAKKVLQGLGVTLKTLDDSNDLRVRYGCIQTLGGYMLRDVRPFIGDPLKFERADYLEPAFLVNPRGLMVSRKGEKPLSIVEQALGGGYVWDDAFHGTGHLANIRRPLKDGFFEHVMNTKEYVIHNFARARVSDADALANVADATRQAKAAAAIALAHQQVDPDLDPFSDFTDRTVPGTPLRRPMNRAGY